MKKMINIMAIALLLGMAGSKIHCAIQHLDLEENLSYAERILLDDVVLGNITCHLDSNINVIEMTKGLIRLRKISRAFNNFLTDTRIYNILTLCVKDGEVLYSLSCCNVVYGDVKNEKVLEFLIKAALTSGADINQFDRFGQTPMYLAVVSHSKKMVQVLLELGANPNIGEETPLLRAVFNRDIQTAELLLKYGANPKINYSALGTPLLMALRLRSESMINLLVSYYKKHNLAFSEAEKKIIKDLKVLGYKMPKKGQCLLQ